MNRNNLKRSLIISIIFLLLSTSSLPMVNAREEKPDLKIIDLIGCLSSKGGSIGVSVTFTNVGKIPIPEGTLTLCNLKVKTLFLPLTICIKWSSTGESLYPDKNGDMIFPIYAPIFGIYRCYTEIDPFNLIEESNENNNIAWAYFIIVNVPFNVPIRIGEVHTSV